jgi:hypothetical protein
VSRARARASVVSRLRVFVPRLQGSGGLAVAGVCNWLIGVGHVCRGLNICVHVYPQDDASPQILDILK